MTGPALGQTSSYVTWGFSILVAGTAGGFQPQNFSLALSTGATFIGGPITSIYEFSNLQGSSYVMFSAAGGFSYSGSPTFVIPAFTLNQIYYALPNGTFNYLLDPGQMVVSSTSAPINPIWSFTSFVNRLFMCNGDQIYKWDGVLNTSLASIFNGSAEWFGGSLSSITTTIQVYPYYTSGPPTLTPAAFAYKYCLPPGSSLYAAVSGTLGFGQFNSATYTYSYGYINDRGFFGPVSSPITVSGITFSTTNVFLYGFSTLVGPTFSYSGFSIPSGYGIGTSQIVSYVGFSISQFQQIAVYRDNGPGTGRYLLSIHGTGTQLGFNDNGEPTSTTPEPTCIYATLPPKYLEIYNNQLFMCGFSQAPSTVQFSDIGEPESIQPENNFDVRTNDGDFLTGMKSAFSQLFFFKNKSFHVLQGSDPTNFQLTPISDQYGCISDRAIATYESNLLFLDKKGIVMYNGAIPSVASTKLDPIFANMNISAANNVAWMIHHKERNQVWTGIPVNGSTLINQIIVFDYLLNAWTHFDGVNAACAAIGFGSQPHSTVYFGGYSGFLGYYGPSLTSDFGNAITLMAKSRFISDMGQSVEKMWRRLFINQVSAAGSTVTWNVNFYADYQTAIAATVLHQGLTFQTRTDFGIPAKALSIQFITSNSSDIIGLQGFTIESRFQRAQ